jgi:hypothetical protein
VIEGDGIGHDGLRKVWKLSRPSFIPAVIYKDNRAALNWLRKAFGFEVGEVLTDDNDNIVHAEMKHGDLW